MDAAAIDHDDDLWVEKQTPIKEDMHVGPVPLHVNDMKMDERRYVRISFKNLA